MAFSEGPAFRVRGRSLARDGDSSSERGSPTTTAREEEEEEERTSSFEEQRASSTLAHLDVSGFFVNELESGASPRLDLAALMIDGGVGGGSSSSGDSSRVAASAFGGGGGGGGSVVPGGGAEAYDVDDAAASFFSTGSDEYLPTAAEREDDDDDEDDPGSSSGSSGSSGFGSFYGTSVETVINARLASARRSHDHRIGAADVVKASGVVVDVNRPPPPLTTTSFARDRGDVGDLDLPTTPRVFGSGDGGGVAASFGTASGGGHVSRPRFPRGGRGSHGKPPLPTATMSVGACAKSALGAELAAAAGIKKRASLADDLMG